MARHASPHSAASVCLMTGRNARSLKFNSPCMRLHSCAKYPIKQPLHQRALLKNDVGFKQHIGLKRHFVPIGIDVRSIESHSHTVSRLFEGDGPDSFAAGQYRVRHVCHAAAVGTEFLIRKCIVKYPYLLARAYEAERARRKEQLRLQVRIKGNDFELHMPWICELADSRLQRRDAPIGRRLDYESLPPVHFGDALFDRGEIIAQYSKPLCDDCRKLLERMLGVGQLAASRGDLLINRHQALLLLEGGLLAALQLNRRQRPARGQRSTRRHEILGKLQPFVLDLSLILELGDLSLDSLDRGSQAVLFGGGSALFRRDLSLDHIALLRQHCKHGAVDIIAVGGDLRSDYGQERLTLGNLLTLLHLYLFDETLLRYENLGRAGGRGQIAADRFLARVLCDGEKTQNDDDKSRKSPTEDRAGHRLQRYDLAPAVALTQEIDCLLAK